MSFESPSAGLRAWVREALSGLAFQRREVSFLLGTDELIRRERRVAMTPRHIDALSHDLAALGLEARIFVVRGAGERAASEAGEIFTDQQYAAAGAELVDRDRVGSIGALDVAHALKEPTEWEREIPGPVIRIGALHLASRPAGLRGMV